MMTPQEIKKENRLSLSAMHALLGIITPNIRAINLDWKGSTITINFIFCGEILSEDLENAELCRNRVQEDFPADIVTVHCLRIDYPQDLPKADMYAYLKKRPR